MTHGLEKIRKRRKLTQDELAAASGVDQTTISFLERGARPNPLWSTVDALSHALKVRPHDLFPSYFEEKR
jgi:transcriptional regulator with XRE-family HTH domain